MIPLRQGFGLNTNLLETNVLNLAVVVGVVIKVVGDSLRSLLDQRRRTILSTLQEADLKAREAKQRLEAAQRTLEEARSRVQEIRIQTIQAVEREKSVAQNQLERDLNRLRERRDQTIQLERNRATQLISYQVFSLALNSAENILMNVLGSQNTSNSKQKELNEMHVRKTFCQLLIYNNL
jgi:F-type H+-transporting ATPase subunit b